MKRWLGNAALTVASLCCCLLLFELLVRAFYPMLANYNLEMWRYASSIKCFTADPRLPFFHFPNRSGSFYGAGISTNSHGYRDVERSTTKPAGKRRIALVGDSIAMGWGVPFEKTIAQALERRLNREGDCYEVLNMGVGNYDSVMETELFEREGTRLEPDTVVLLYFINDAEPVPQCVGATEFLRRHSYLMAVLFDRYVKLWPRVAEGRQWQRYYAALYEPENPALALNRSALAHLCDICQQRGIRLLVANYPELHQLRDYPFPMATQYIRTLADERHVPFVDLLPALQRHEPPTLWVSEEDTHGNALASDVVAEELANALKAIP